MAAERGTGGPGRGKVSTALWESWTASGPGHVVGSPRRAEGSLRAVWP